MTDPSTMQGMPGTQTTELFGGVRARLSQLRRQLRWYYFVSGLNQTIIVGSCCAMVLMGIWLALRPPELVMGILSFAAVAFTLAVLVRRLLYPISRSISDTDLVVLVEREYPLLNDRLISALQLIRYTGPAGHSPVMVRTLLRDAEELSTALDFNDVLKPQRLTPAGFGAMFCSLALVTASVAMSLRSDGGLKLGISVDFPEASADARTETLAINFANRQPGERSANGVAAEIVAAEKSDLVIDAWPRGLVAEASDFDLSTYPHAMLAIESDELGIVREPMDIASSSRGPGLSSSLHFRKVLHSMVRGSKLWVEWVDGSRSRKYAITLEQPLSIEDHEIIYRVPQYMRTRDVAVKVERTEWKATVVPTPDGAGLEVTMPQLDDKRAPIAENGAWKMATRTFASEAEFEQAEPETYRAWARETVEDRPLVQHTEEAEVLFRITTNKPLDIERSFLGVDRPIPRGVGDDSTPAPQTRFELTRRADDTNGTKWQAQIRLARDMKAYWFHLVDSDGLRSMEDAHYPIQVKRDRPPSSRFVDTGVPLTEGGADRHATPGGSFPLVVTAEDEFGLRGLRLQYRRSTDPEEQWTDVPGFSERIASRIASQPPSITARFTVDMVPLFRDVQVTDDKQLALYLRLVARDTKDQTNEINAGSLPITIWTPDKLRGEIRRLLRNVIRPRVQDLRTWQAGLINATRLYRANPGDLKKGVKINRVFPDEDRTTDSRGLPIMFNGSRAVQMQNKITDDARTLARNIDAIVRHFVYNDLESDNLDSPQESTLQKMKTLLAMICVEKRVALELDKQMAVFGAADTSDADRTAAINQLLAGLLTDPGVDNSVQGLFRFGIVEDDGTYGFPVDLTVAV